MLTNYLFYSAAKSVATRQLLSNAPSLLTKENLFFSLFNLRPVQKPHSFLHMHFIFLASYRLNVLLFQVFNDGRSGWRCYGTEGRVALSTFQSRQEKSTSDDMIKTAALPAILLCLELLQLLLERERGNLKATSDNTIASQ